MEIKHNLTYAAVEKYLDHPAPGVLSEILSAVGGTPATVTMQHYPESGFLLDTLTYQIEASQIEVVTSLIGDVPIMQVNAGNWRNVWEGMQLQLQAAVPTQLVVDTLPVPTQFQLVRSESQSVTIFRAVRLNAGVSQAANVFRIYFACNGLTVGHTYHIRVGITYWYSRTGKWTREGEQL